MEGQIVDKVKVGSLGKPVKAPFFGDSCQRQQWPDQLDRH